MFPAVASRCLPGAWKEAGAARRDLQPPSFSPLPPPSPPNPAPVRPFLPFLALPSLSHPFFLSLFSSSCLSRFLFLSLAFSLPFSLFLFHTLSLPIDYLLPPLSPPFTLHLSLLPSFENSRPCIHSRAVAASSPGLFPHPPP